MPVSRACSQQGTPIALDLQQIVPSCQAHQTGRSTAQCSSSICHCSMLHTSISMLLLLYANKPQHTDSLSAYHGYLTESPITNSVSQFTSPTQLSWSTPNLFLSISHELFLEIQFQKKQGISRMYVMDLNRIQCLPLAA